MPKHKGWSRAKGTSGFFFAPLQPKQGKEAKRIFLFLHSY